MGKKRLAIFASGSGTNAEAIAKYFSGHGQVEVAMVLSNKPDAYVLKRAERLGIASRTFSRKDFYESDEVLDILSKGGIEYIVLAGFLWLVPKSLILAFPERIINIHPALLPKYGGKGMYGARVHEALIANRETESGITIHLVDEIYDNGRILCQEKVDIGPSDTPDSLAQKIHELEYKYFPRAIEDYVLGK